MEAKRIGSKQYRTTVKFPDKVWTIIEDGSFGNFVRDTKGNLYGFRGKDVVRFNDAGEEIGTLTIPKSEFKAIETSPDWPSDVDVPLTVVVEYGQPVVGPNGNIYTWKRTPDKYSIIKWTWQE
ncbi:MAG: hypothetical protein RQ824_12275 [bacterium]|nr:hypothetical protein [bacterium]